MEFMLNDKGLIKGFLAGVEERPGDEEVDRIESLYVIYNPIDNGLAKVVSYGDLKRKVITKKCNWWYALEWAKNHSIHIW